MHTSHGRISFLQLAMIFLLVNGLTSHVIINPVVLDASGRDAWLIPFFIAVPLAIWCILLYYIMKKSGQQKLQPWLAQKTNPVVAWLLVVPLYIQVYLIGATTLLHTTGWTVTNYLPSTPKMVLSIVLVLICGYAAVSGIRAIAIGAGILLPFVIVLGYFVAIANTPEKELGLLRPFLEYGPGPVFEGMITAGGGLTELILLIALQHHLKAPVKLWYLLVLGLVLLHIMLGPLVGAITEFGPVEAAKQTESPYEQWRLVTVGDFIEHVDFFSVYQWLAGTSIRISLSLYLLSDLLPLPDKKMRKRFIIGMAISYFGISMVPINQLLFYKFMSDYYFQITLYVMVALALIWFLISIFAKSGQERKV
ncbi:endospore germination permease [Paenibacillus lutrae]|uniref:GerAB/ArcD/ProY family transporter n=1 Tax=Paenibacillus lutrae TaxID=2078573 RepID=A0A7X3JXJ2_9BACL|nr:endospore germination permease [Paenibacillus lutrae]MVO98103.1 GerAB/ArcD/ProY family transporter [Paenibacillus lutrae]